MDEMRIFWLVVMAICAFGLWLLKDERHDPFKVLAVCACMGSSAISIYVLYLLVRIAFD